MKSYFEAGFFVNNRARLRQSIDEDTIIVVAANGQVQKSADSAFPFQQDTHFWYLTGIESPDATLVIGKNEEYLIMPDLTDYQLAFDGSLETGWLTSRSGIKDVLAYRAGWKKLAINLTQLPKVATIFPPSSYLKIYSIYTNPARRRLLQKIRRINPSLEIIDLRINLAHIRMVKQAPELKALEKAIEITVETLDDVASQLDQFEYEFQIENELSYGFKKRGGGVAFDSVIAAGEKATTIHTHASKDKIKAEDLIVLDVGAEVEQYDADITRTFSVSGKPNSRQQEIYQAVLEVQDYAMSLQKPGPTIRQNEKLVEEFMGRKLRQLSLIKTDKREDIRRYFPHATSHFLGLDTHDTGDYDAPLEAGMVLTVEPGIYIPEEGIGVRIEDDLLITEDGSRNLSAKLRRKLL